MSVLGASTTEPSTDPLNNALILSRWLPICMIVTSFDGSSPKRATIKRAAKSDELPKREMAILAP